MKLNCDMGESFGSWSKGMDAEVMPYIDMANIACGFHASDPMTMDLTVRMALENNVEIGAHPGYPDLLGFGRRDLTCSAQELKMIVTYQIAALDGICRVNGSRISYVKPHGALYNKMMQDADILSAVIAGVADYNRELALVVLANGDRDACERLADAKGLRLLFEAFADRSYDDNGCLVRRNLPGAVHSNQQQIEKQVLEIVREGKVTSQGGRSVPLRADTICVHGDNEHAVSAARHIRESIGVL